MAESKSVLFVITQTEYGGAQRFLYNLLARLDKAKFRLLVVVGQPTGPDFLLGQLQALHIPVVTLPALTRAGGWQNDLRAAWALRRFIRSSRPDTVFLNSSKAGFLGALAIRSLATTSRPRVIYRIGGWTFNDPWPRYKKVYYQWLERLSAHWKDVIIVNSQADYTQAEQLGIRPRESLQLIANGLDPYKLNFLPREEARLRLFERLAKQRGRVFQTKFIVGTLANHYPAKGLNYLVEAAGHFRQQDQVLFVIIGSGPLTAELQTQINQQNLGKKVFLLGNIPDAATWLLGLDVFVLPSLKEGFPWALLEAMAAKLPVIATAVGAVPEIIQDGENGYLVAPANPEQIVLRLRELFNDNLKPTELGISAHQTVLLQYSLDKMINRISDIL